MPAAAAVKDVWAQGAYLSTVLAHDCLVCVLLKPASQGVGTHIGWPAFWAFSGALLLKTAATGGLPF
jgi:hypothetical protein